MVLWQLELQLDWDVTKYSSSTWGPFFARSSPLFQAFLAHGAPALPVGSSIHPNASKFSQDSRRALHWSGSVVAVVVAVAVRREQGEIGEAKIGEGFFATTRLPYNKITLRPEKDLLLPSSDGTQHY